MAMPLDAIKAKLRTANTTQEVLVEVPDTADTLSMRVSAEKLALRERLWMLLQGLVYMETKKFYAASSLPGDHAERSNKYVTVDEQLVETLRDEFQNLTSNPAWHSDSDLTTRMLVHVCYAMGSFLFNENINTYGQVSMFRQTSKLAEEMGIDMQLIRRASISLYRLAGPDSTSISTQAGTGVRLTAFTPTADVERFQRLTSPWLTADMSTANILQNIADLAESVHLPSDADDMGINV